MRVSSSLAIKSLAASASASAVVTPRAGLDVNPGHNNDDKFVLQTHTINGAGYNGLYVYAYHAGAGNNAMLDTDRTVGNKATAHANRMFPYFVVQYFIGRSPYQLIPKPMGYSPYPGLLPVAINVNGDPPSATNAFYFEGNSLKWTDNTTTKGGFAGWLACKSRHESLEDPDVPGVQLFYRTTPGQAPPGGCNDIDLVPFYLPKDEDGARALAPH